MELYAGLVVWAVGTIVLLYAAWQARPAARWPLVRREHFTEFVRRYSAPDSPLLASDLERAVTAVTRSAVPRRHAHARPRVP